MTYSTDSARDDIPGAPTPLRRVREGQWTGDEPYRISPPTCSECGGLLARGSVEYLDDGTARETLCCPKCSAKLTEALNVALAALCGMTAAPKSEPMPEQSLAPAEWDSGAAWFRVSEALRRAVQAQMELAADLADPDTIEERARAIRELQHMIASCERGGRAPT